LTPEQYLVPANDFETFGTLNQLTDLKLSITFSHSFAGLQGDSIFSFFFAFDDPTEPQTVGIMGQKFLENFVSFWNV
jgi:hypothetical protein